MPWPVRLIGGLIVRIDGKLITYLERLSYLKLSKEEKKRIAGDLRDILRHMAQLSKLPMEGVPERSHPFDHINAFREDEVRDSFDRALILSNATEKSREMFIAPQTVE